MKTYEIEKAARIHLEHIINLGGGNKEKLLFKLASFYGTFLTVLEEKEKNAKEKV